VNLPLYPERPAERDAWIVAHRPERAARDPYQPHAYLLEEERAASGAIVSVATLFLTNRECPWRCAMCDLWRNTLTENTPPGAIPEQIEYALGQLASDMSDAAHPARHIKLYNSGSFFDPRAIPPADYFAISQAVRRFERVIVENHPALVGDACLRFRDLLGGDFEIAMGLETAHPGVLEKLNKRLTLDQFQSAAEFLRRHGIGLRVFILVQPPFMASDEALHWAERSLDFAFDCGATAATLIPTHAGNGAMEALARSGQFAPPPLATLESAMEYGLRLGRGRVFADAWDLPRPIDCPACGAARATRLRAMNLTQQIVARVPCERCQGQS
jgi:radical SAM enzyme (TIGR01210 family)